MCNNVNVKKIIQATVVNNQEIKPDYFVLDLDTQYLAENSVPGQFVTVKVEDKTTDPLLRIPLAVHAVQGKNIQLLYKIVGSGTEKLSKKQQGDTLNILGSLGNGFKIQDILQDKNKKAIIIAGGHGIAPLCFLAEKIKKEEIEINFFIGANTGKHVLCLDKLKELGIRVHVATEDGTSGHEGFVTDLLKEHLRVISGESCLSAAALAKEEAAVFACGPKPMIAVVAEIAKEAGISAQVSLDAYMACGIGACLGCAVPAKAGGYKLVCKDGPVFDAEEIDWEEEK